MPIKKNDIINIEITGLTAEGSGIGRYESLAIFVPNTAIGDRLKVRILKVKKNYAFAKIEKLEEASKDRIAIDCEAYYKCGGCVFRHINYEAELLSKRQRVEDAISRIAGIKDVQVNDIVGSASENFYRNKAQIPVGYSRDKEIVLGFFAPHSHRIVPCETCLLQPKTFQTAINYLKLWMKEFGIKAYDELSHSGVIRHLYLRLAQKTDELMVCVVVNSKTVVGEERLVEILKAGLPNLKTVVINYNTTRTNVILGQSSKIIYGDGYITDQLCGLKFNISPLSFYQVNRDQAENLYNKAKSYAALSKEDILLDLYCGTGTIGLTMASDVKKLIGVEIIPQAIDDAKANAKLNNIKNAEFICADAADAAKMLDERGEKPSVIVLDPPRKGCNDSLIATVINMNPNRIVYVSCDPATLARDIKKFKENGFKINDITPFDMFPRTNHVETVVLMSHEK